MKAISRSIIVLAVAAGALLAVGLSFARFAGSATDKAGSVERPIAVSTTEVVERDVPIYRVGIGFVEAFNKVSVTPRVEGQLISIFFKEGQAVRAGDVLALIDPRPFEAILSSKNAILRASKARAAAAKANLERMIDLMQREVGTRQALENQQALYAELEAQIDGAEADVLNASLQLEYTDVRSPIDGRVGLKQVDQGNVVRPGGPAIATITQVQPISIVFSLPQEDIPIINAQLEAGRVLKVNAVARDSKQDLGSGDLATIDNQVDSKTGTFKLKAVFANETMNLWPGQFVSVKLMVEESRRAIAVPAAAIQRGPDGAYVYVVDPLYKAVMRQVSVELVQDGYAAVKSGLAIGESVIVEGQFKLRPGILVEVRDKGGPAPPMSSSPTQRPG